MGKGAGGERKAQHWTHYHKEEHQALIERQWWMDNRSEGRGGAVATVGAKRNRELHDFLAREK